jgi:hypothetical protein
MSVIQGTIKPGQISRKEFVSVYFKVSGSAIVGDSWIKTEIPNTPAEGVIKRARAIKLSGDATTLDFFVSEDDTMLLQDTPLKYQNINLTQTDSTHLDSEEEIYYNLIQRSATNYSYGTMHVYLKCDTLENNIWYRLDVMVVG